MSQIRLEPQRVRSQSRRKTSKSKSQICSEENIKGKTFVNPGRVRKLLAVTVAIEQNFFAAKILLLGQE